MTFRYVHRFPCTVSRFWEIFWDPEYDRRLDEAAGTRHTVLREWQEGEIHCWRTRYEADGQSQDAARLLGGGLFEYEQEARLDKGAGRLTWEVFPKLNVGGSFKAQGTVEVRELGGQTERVIEGEIRVGIPILGAKIEEAVRDRLAKSYEGDARIVLEMLRGA